MVERRLATCARCQRPRRQVRKVMPDGPLCAACHAAAVRSRGRCAGCGDERLLPGMDGMGRRMCRRCAGIDEDYTCRRCGTEWQLVNGLCEWCQLGDVLDGLLVGDVDLQALRTRLLEAARPDRIIIWLYAEHARDLLHRLSTGAVPLTHAALDEFGNRPAADHVRGLLVAVGLLPAREEGLARFDRWVAEHLAEHAATTDDFKLLSQFATWRLRAVLARGTADKPVSEGQMNGATQRLRVAGALLAWLRGRGRELAQCTQADLDVWFATPPSTHVHAIPFLRWAMGTRRAPKLELSRGRFGNARVLDQAERLDILRRLLDPSTGHLQHRVAAMMLVLLGQPFTRIAALSLSDVEVDADDVRVRLGDGVVPIPQPFAAMVTELIAGRPNLNTATNPTSPFLFPGRSADNHLLASTLRTAAIRMGIDLMGARSGALRQLVLECPPAVVADALGYSYQVMDLHARRAGSPWSSYAALRTKAPHERCNGRTG
jgi:integrase